jgi:hypothetical protein
MDGAPSRNGSLSTDTHPHPQKRRAATLAGVRPVFRFSKIRFGTGPQRHVISVLPGTCEPKPAFPEPTVITVVAKALLVLSPCVRLPARLIRFPHPVPQTSLAGPLIPLPSPRG